MVSVYSKFTSLEGRYAKALYLSLSVPEDAYNLVQEGQSFIELLRSNSDLQNTLMRPLVPRPIQEKVLMRVLESSKYSESFKRFIFLIARHNRLPSLERIFTCFREIHLLKQNLWPICVKTAEPLVGESKGYHSSLIALIKKAFGANSEIKHSVDPSLIAGFQVITNDKIIDGSLKKQLTLLKKIDVGNKS